MVNQISNVMDVGGNLKRFVNEYCDKNTPADKSDNGYWSDDLHHLDSDDEEDKEEKCDEESMKEDQEYLHNGDSITHLPD